MYFKTLKTHNFRNLEASESEFGSGFNFLFGDNGHGKSNLLEALYFLAFLQGFRTKKSNDLIRWGEAGFSVSALADVGHSTRELTVNVEKKCRRIFENGVPVGKISDYVGIVRVVLFQPEDVALFRLAPGERRDFLDRMVFNDRPAYMEYLQYYKKAVAQKSAYLKSEAIDPLLAEVYERQQAEVGARVERYRLQFLSEIRPYLREVLKDIFDFECEIAYRSSIFGMIYPFEQDLSKIEEGFAEAVFDSRATDMRMKQVTVGPHREDWHIEFAGHAAKMGSQGQQRAFVLAMKMAELKMLKEKRGINPVMLLDDIAGEFDERRLGAFFEILHGEKSQIFITSALDLTLPGITDCARFRVVDGRCRFLASS